MKTFLTRKRCCGILAHITSLPGPYGVGDVGLSSYAFIDFLVKANQSYWQFLPIGPTNSVFDNSPYMSTSAFAGSPLLISPDLLYENNLLKKSQVSSIPDFSPFSADFIKAADFKRKLLQRAFTNHTPAKDVKWQKFIEETDWLEDYALFMTLKEVFKGSGWYTWPEKLASRKKDALGKIKATEKDKYTYYCFEQYVFYTQWKKLRDYAKEKGITLFGDIPFYVGLDSTDVWANQELFTLDIKTHLPTAVAGVPPDYFSKTGQRWGNPLYRWEASSPVIKKKLKTWWISRLKLAFEQVEVARIDHFRGFESYWAIPAECATAIDGSWLKGPGKQFFKEMEATIGSMKIVAEDLGIINDAVRKLRDDLKLPGMRVLQFAFDGNPDNPFLPHNFDTQNCVVYTGTHDNDTSVGWFLSDQLSDDDRVKVKEYCNRKIFDETGIHQDLIYLALSSVAALSIFPLQDILGFGNDCKMNTPGISTGNWSWRCAPRYLDDETAAWLSEKTTLFGRGRQK